MMPRASRSSERIDRVFATTKNVSFAGCGGREVVRGSGFVARKTRAGTGDLQKNMPALREDRGFRRGQRVWWNERMTCS